MCDSMRAFLPETLRKRLSAIGQRIATDRTGTERTALVLMVEQAIERVEPLLAAVEEAASARQKRGAALRAALDDIGWKPDQLKVALGQKSRSSVSRYLEGTEPIPDRIYALPELGKAFHRRCGQVFGISEEKSA